jgi:hypothetical protein
MTTQIALEYIPRRMKQLGYGTEYYIRFRHLVLQPQEGREIDAFNQFYILIEEPQSIMIFSEFGFFDLSSDRVNEQSYEHQGAIGIINTSNEIRNVRFIQVIPKHRPIKSKE